MTQPLADIGLIGLAVMGENFALNMESKGFRVAVFNRTVERVEQFIAGRARGKNFVGARTPAELVAALQRPRKILMLIKAGPAVDAVMDELLLLLDKGDILIDGGNSLFTDTIRRTKQVEAAGMLYVGSGVSGGEEGALTGPSLMPGGSAAAWQHIKPIFQAVCARTPEGEPCCDWMGEDGAGHFVKMVHNGIEYGDMQLIAETYDVMKRVVGMSNAQMHEVFAEWNARELDSYLIANEIDVATSHVRAVLGDRIGSELRRLQRKIDTLAGYRIDETGGVTDEAAAIACRFQRLQVARRKRRNRPGVRFQTSPFSEAAARDPFGHTLAQFEGVRGVSLRADADGQVGRSWEGPDVARWISDQLEEDLLAGDAMNEESGCNR